MSDVYNDIQAERAVQKAKAHGGDTDAFDQSLTRNDWVAMIAAYNGRASAKVFRNIRENQDFRDNMIKVAALAVAAIEAHDKGWLKP